MIYGGTTSRRGIVEYVYLDVSKCSFPRIAFYFLHYNILQFIIFPIYFLIIIKKLFYCYLKLNIELLDGVTDGTSKYGMNSITNVTRQLCTNVCNKMHHSNITHMWFECVL